MNYCEENIDLVISNENINEDLEKFNNKTVLLKNVNVSKEVVMTLIEKCKEVIFINKPTNENIEIVACLSKYDNFKSVLSN